jgi:hypothetical protein
MLAEDAIKAAVQDYTAKNLKEEVVVNLKEEVLEARI